MTVEAKIIVETPWVLNETEYVFQLDIPEDATPQQIKEAAEEEFRDKFRYAIQVLKDGKDVTRDYERYF